MESKEQTKLIKKLEDGGALCFNIHGHAYQKRGWPDVQVYSRIWTGHLELKWKTRSLTPLQKDRMEELKQRWTSCYVVRFFEDFVYIEDEKGYILDNFLYKMLFGQDWLCKFRDLDNEEDR